MRGVADMLAKLFALRLGDNPEARRVHLSYKGVHAR